ncbi:MAG: hypothetical protein AB7V56_10860 [Candidatus Nitrosocosmicus sp.]
MNKAEKKKTAFLIGISIVAIALLLLVNVRLVQTSENQYANYFASVTQSSVNLTRDYQDKIGLWDLGQISNSSMALITDDYLRNFTTQLDRFNQTESPDVFKDAKNSLANSFANEIKSYEYFKDFLVTGNETMNQISTVYLSKSLEDEANAFKYYKDVINGTKS